MLCNFVSLKWAGWSARWMALTWPWSQYLWRCWSLHLNVAVYSKKFESRPVHLIHCLIQDLMVVLGIWLKILIIIANDWQTEHHLSVDVCKALKQHEATFRIQTFQWNVTWYIYIYIYISLYIIIYMISYGPFHLSLIQVLGVARRRPSHSYHEPTCRHCVPRCHVVTVVQIGRGRIWNVQNEYDMSTTES